MYTLKILKMVFQPMIESQSDINRIVFDDVEIGRNENRILGSSRTVIVCSRKTRYDYAHRKVHHTSLLEYRGNKGRKKIALKEKHSLLFFTSLGKFTFLA